MNTPTEREIKFTFAADAVLPRWQGLSAGVHVDDRGIDALDATYWDTKDLVLANNHLGVRRRLGSGWTFKGPSHREGDAVVREEREWPDSEAMPEALAQRVSAAVGPVELVPVARILTWRHRLDVLSADGRRLLEIADDSVSVLDGDREVERFREVEVEVVGDAPTQVIEEITTALIGAGAAIHTTGKYTRALRALGRVKPDEGSIGQPPPSSPL